MIAQAQPKVQPTEKNLVALLFDQSKMRQDMNQEELTNFYQWLNEAPTADLVMLRLHLEEELEFEAK